MPVICGVVLAVMILSPLCVCWKQLLLWFAYLCIQQCSNQLQQNPAMNFSLNELLFDDDFVVVVVYCPPLFILRHWLLWECDSVMVLKLAWFLFTCLLFFFFCFFFFNEEYQSVKC